MSESYGGNPHLREQCLGRKTNAETWADIKELENPVASAGSQGSQQSSDNLKRMKRQKLEFETFRNPGFEVQDLGEEETTKKWAEH